MDNASYLTFDINKNIRHLHSLLLPTGTPTTALSLSRLFFIPKSPNLLFYKNPPPPPNSSLPLVFSNPPPPGASTTPVRFYSFIPSPPSDPPPSTEVWHLRSASTSCFVVEPVRCQAVARRAIFVDVIHPCYFIHTAPPPH